MATVRQIKDLTSGTNFPSVEAFFASVNYYQQGFGTNRTITVSGANVLAIDDTMISGVIAIGANSTQNQGGVCVAQNAGNTIAGAITSFTDAQNYIANKVEIRDSVTNDPVLVNGKKVFGLLQCVSSAADGDTIGASGSENIMISFVTLSDTDVLTLVSVTGTFEYTYFKRYAKRFIPDKTIIGTTSDIDVIAPYVPSIEKLVVTTQYPANAVITLSSGAGSPSGAGTVTNAVLLPASAPLFASTTTCQVYRNGIRQEKGVDVIWNSTGSLHFVDILDVTEEIEIQV